MNRVPHLIHVFPTFGLGGTELRITRLINALGLCFRHSILPLDGSSEAATSLDPQLSVRVLARPQAKSGPLFWIELHRIIQSIQPTLVVTYNWGAIEAILPAKIGAFCPVIHNESGFGP